MPEIVKIANSLPHLPGVYQFLDSAGKIIYIGKAKDIHKRVASYFNKKVNESNKIRILVKQIADIKHIVVENESDALLLENNLIKQLQPKYNVLLKDDKSFPWICIKNESFPRVFISRKLIHDGSEYFGPYTSAYMVKTMLSFIRDLYPLRTCSFNLTFENINKEKFRKCLEFHIGNCKAPCEKLQSENEYLDSIRQIKNILKGNIQEVINHLKKLMLDYSMSYQFENAEKIKQKVFLLEKYKSKSTIVNPKLKEIDVFSYIEKKEISVVNYLKIINGAITQSHNVELLNRMDEPREKLLLYAVLDIREKVKSVAKEILIPFRLSDNIPGIKLTVPKVGDKKKVLDLSERNAKQYLIQKDAIIDQKSFQAKIESLLLQVKTDLHLKCLPKRIECFDNSNIQGTAPVASCVVFINGKPCKKEYRHYNIRTVTGANDFASMEEVIYRRYKRILDEKAEVPDLIVIDGGKGQVKSAGLSLQKLNLQNSIPVIGIAKRLEEVYFPHDSIPLYLDKKSTTLKLLQNIRNEAHRFGLKLHQKKRSKNMLGNQLEQIKGVGPKSTEKLIKVFGSVEAIKEQPCSAIVKVVGERIASKIVEVLKNI